MVNIVLPQSYRRNLNTCMHVHDTDNLRTHVHTTSDHNQHALFLDGQEIARILYSVPRND